MDSDSESESSQGSESQQDLKSPINETSPASPSLPDALDVERAKSESSSQGELTPKLRSKHQKPDRQQQRRVILETSPENRTDSDLFILDELMVHSDALRSLSSNARLRLTRQASLVLFPNGASLFKKGDPATDLYIISSGEVLCQFDDQTYCAREGHSLGELEGTGRAGVTSHSTSAAAIRAFSSSPYASPRLTSVTSSSSFSGRDRGSAVEDDAPRWAFSATANGGPVECAVIAQSTWIKVMEEEPTWDVSKVASFLEDVPIFGSLSKTQLWDLSRMVTIVRRSAGSVVYQKSSGTSHDLYLIRFGYVRLLRSVKLDSNSRHTINKMAGKVTHMRAKLEQGKGFGVVHGKARGPSNVAPRAMSKSPTKGRGDKAVVQDKEASPTSPKVSPTGSQASSKSGSGGKQPARVFSVNTPRVLVEGEDEEVNVEVALVTSGQCFGEAARASAAPHAATAVADTAVELLLLNYQELRTRMGPAALADLSFLWTPECLEPGGTVSVLEQRAANVHIAHADDETIRKQLQSSLEWELYKKQLVSNIVGAKASAISALRR